MEGTRALRATRRAFSPRSPRLAAGERSEAGKETPVAVANSGMRQGSRSSLAPDPEQGSVVAWRTERLVAVGLDEELAGRLAGDRAVDLHALLELVDRGCPPDLAARILAPLEEDGRR
jgi:hypothetical protein